jgi:hypothetical protein
MRRKDAIGCFRALAEQPDPIIEHRPAHCPGCGHGFAPDALGGVVGERFVIPIWRRDKEVGYTQLC